MFVLVHYNTHTNQVDDSYREMRYINKASCLKAKKFLNESYKTLGKKTYKYIRTECFSARDYITRHPGAKP